MYVFVSQISVFLLPSVFLLGFTVCGAIESLQREQISLNLGSDGTVKEELIFRQFALKK